MKLDGDLIEGGGTVNRAFDADQAGVGEIEIQVGSCGLRLKAKLPLVGLGEPDGEVGVEKGEGLFFSAAFEVDAGRTELNVGEAQGGGRVPQPGWGVGSARSLDEQRAEIPLAAGIADKIDAGVVEGRCG